VSRVTYSSYKNLQYFKIYFNNSQFHVVSWLRTHSVCNTSNRSEEVDRPAKSCSYRRNGQADRMLYTIAAIVDRIIVHGLLWTTPRRRPVWNKSVLLRTWSIQPSLVPLQLATTARATSAWLACHTATTSWLAFLRHDPAN